MIRNEYVCYAYYSSIKFDFIFVTNSIHRKSQKYI